MIDPIIIMKIHRFSKKLRTILQRRNLFSFIKGILKKEKAWLAFNCLILQLRNMILVQLKIQKRLLIQWRGLLSLQKKEFHRKKFLLYLINYEYTYIKY